MSIPIYYELTSTEKFKKEYIRNNLIQNLGGLLFKKVGKNINKGINLLNANLNELCAAKEKEDEKRKKFVLQKVKNMKNIITSLTDIKKLSSTNNNNENNSTNMSTILFDNSVAIRDFEKMNTVNNIWMLNKLDQNEVKKQRNYGRSMIYILTNLLLNFAIESLILRNKFFLLSNYFKVFNFL